MKPDEATTALPVVKTCKCGRSFTAESWRALPYVGKQPGIVAMEMRNCLCGSTIAIIIIEE